MIDDESHLIYELSLLVNIKILKLKTKGITARGLKCHK